MKTLIRFLFLICIFTFSSTVFGQISNLLVNGSSTHFSMASGSEISWSYNLPVGGTALLEFWIDVNENTIIEPATDVLWESFYQTDGQSSYDGPPDMDGLANGQIVFSQPVGLAAGEYIMSFSNNSTAVTISGTVTPLVSPVFIISGNITVPAGKSAQYLALSFNNSGENGGKFWNAITDVNGNFAVLMDVDTSGNPWRLRIDNAQSLSPAVVNTDEITLFLDAGVATSYPGNNFTFTEAAAEINGIVKDDDGNPIIGVYVYISGNEGNWNRNTKSDLTGSFRLGFLSNELPTSNAWLGAGYSEDNSMVSAGTELPTVNSGNVITKNLFLYKTNSTISGTVTLSGNPPNMNLEIMAIVSDTGFVRTYTDFNGNYTLNVSNKLYNYDVGSRNLPPDYMPYSVLAHPGQTNVNFNFNLTDVEQDQSINPDEYSLLQNFPNPFNPVTTIGYVLQENSNAKLTVINAIGEEIAVLVNQEQGKGFHKVEFEGSKLSSGVYFYKLVAKDFVSIKKLMLVR